MIVLITQDFVQGENRTHDIYNISMDEYITCAWLVLGFLRVSVGTGRCWATCDTLRACPLLGQHNFTLYLLKILGESDDCHQPSLFLTMFLSTFGLTKKDSFGKVSVF